MLNYSQTYLLMSVQRTPPQDKNGEHRRIWRLKNTKRAQRRWKMETRACNAIYQRNLNNTFAAAAEQEYHTPIGAIAEAALLGQQLPPNLQIQSCNI
jgi:hypothetical protein